MDIQETSIGFDISALVECTRCGEESIVCVENTSDFEKAAIGLFTKEGWRETPGNIVCPECAKLPDEEIDD